jgi:acyl-coenzyme A synthetase/AMP-(fatty) acid ligase
VNVAHASGWFVLCSSGTTAEPKAIVHTTGGSLVGVAATGVLYEGTPDHSARPARA